MFTSRPIFLGSLGVAPLVTAQESDKKDAAMTTPEQVQKVYPRSAIVTRVNPFESVKEKPLRCRAAPAT